MAEVNWTDQALDDLKAIAAYVSRDSAKYASFQINHLFDRANMLQFHPRIGRVVPEMNKTNIRELIEGSYRIIYRILSSKRIDILTIHHSAQRLTKKKLRSKRK